MSYYHASPTGGITQLKPYISNHGIPLIYFSQKRENTLVYLSNAVEKYCRETGFEDYTELNTIHNMWVLPLKGDKI